MTWAEVVAAEDQRRWQSQIQAKRPDREDVSSSKVHVDCYVASSNQVIDDPNHVFFSQVREFFPKIHAVDMEGTSAGASIRLAQSERALGFLMIRGISDEPGTANAAGSDERLKWKKYASTVAAAFAKTVIETLPRNK